MSGDVLGRVALLVALGGAVLSGPRAASAQPVTASATERARGLFQRGVALADQDRWAEALAVFQQSLELVPRASTRFNLARVLLRLGRLREAIEAFDAYRAEAHGPSEAERLTEAERLRSEAVAALATLRLTGLPDASEVSVDGAVVPGRGSPRVLRIDPGGHRVEVRDAAGHVERFTVTATASQVTEHALVWPAPPPPSFPAAGLLVRPPEAPPPRRSIASSPWLWVGVGTVAAGAAAVLLYVFRPTEDPYPGSTNTVIQGVTGVTF